ncbi:carbohydrate esterase family 12 protein [Hydnum rufescens UP504]|uniref:Carbohydrate esterase family 12 protein n=1 Tax=Hydnum rufescens UP504 TaxID=1448309 RepID=A0A9P6E0H4_9AGAM|nr:carbohydrate esterase family 12 protein [Hydnum rufescens UP504]
MRFIWTLSAAFSAAKSFTARGATSTLYLVGIEGWGVEVGAYLQNINIINKAASGRSARSYIREGKWAAVQALLVPGDFIILSFGHNDGGSPSTSDRASLYGESDTATETITHADGVVEVGATAIISSQTPNNPYEFSSTIVDDPPRFVKYARDVAAAKGVPYVDHFAAVISLYGELGGPTTESYFPRDHTHTNSAGAIQVAQAFISGLKCPSAEGALALYINSVGQELGARC